jgi:hypothetical protein
LDLIHRVVPPPLPPSRLIPPSLLRSFPLSFEIIMRIDRDTDRETERETDRQTVYESDKRVENVREMNLWAHLSLWLVSTDFCLAERRGDSATVN